MAGGIEIRGNKSLSDLGREAAWFVLHTLLALIVLILLVGAFALARPDADASGPKLLCTALAFLVPMVIGFVIARIQKNQIAQYIWISAILVFSLVCVWVLDLPTGNGLCNDCGAVDKLWRTFFSIDKNSGLMGGDGLLIGLWVPLSMIGYAVGAKMGLGEQD
jgi:hypothetical protein